MDVSELLALTAAQATAAIERGDLDAAELFAAYRSRAADEDLNAFTWVAEDLPADLHSDAPLRGVPLAVKDLFCTEGVPSQAGSKILEGYLPPYTATSVARLQDAGVSLLGKTNQDEFAMGSSNENSAYGPVLNPWDRTRVPGGSSGGSAAAVAAGLAPWALGTDTGGSIRQPAALCGIVGLKPTYGTVSRYGMIAFASSLDQAGPFTRDVTDAALLYRHMTGTRPEGLDGRRPSRRRSCCRRPSGSTALRLGIPAELSTGEGVEPGVLAAFEATVETAKSLGATIETCHLPTAALGLSAYYVLAPAEASSNLSRYDGVRYGERVAADDLVSMYTETRHDGFGDEVKRRILIGTYALSSGYYDAYYSRAQKVRTLIAREFTAGLPGRRLRHHADEPHGRLRAGLQDRRPALDVPQRLLHRPDVARRHPGDLDPVRASARACRSACSSAAPRSARTGSSTPPTPWRARWPSTARPRARG